MTQYKPFISLFITAENTILSHIEQADSVAMARENAITAQLGLKHITTLASPKAFMTDDGYLLFQDSPQSYTNGDLFFDANEDCMPHDDEGFVLSGEWIDGLCDEHKDRFIDCIVQHLNLEELKNANRPELHYFCVIKQNCGGYESRLHSLVKASSMFEAGKTALLDQSHCDPAKGAEWLKEGIEIADCHGDHTMTLMNCKVITDALAEELKPLL